MVFVWSRICPWSGLANGPQSTAATNREIFVALPLAHIGQNLGFSHRAGLFNLPFYVLTSHQNSSGWKNCESPVLFQSFEYVSPLNAIKKLKCLIGILVSPVVTFAWRRIRAPPSVIARSLPTPAQCKSRVAAVCHGQPVDMDRSVPYSSWSSTACGCRKESNLKKMTTVEPRYLELSRVSRIVNNYSPKWRWIAVDIYRAASAR